LGQGPTAFSVPPVCSHILLPPPPPPPPTPPTPIPHPPTSQPPRLFPQARRVELERQLHWTQKEVQQLTWELEGAQVRGRQAGAVGGVHVEWPATAAPQQPVFGFWDACSAQLVCPACARPAPAGSALHAAAPQASMATSAAGVETVVAQLPDVVARWPNGGPRELSRV
jgi:hypothetical protein